MIAAALRGCRASIVHGLNGLVIPVSADQKWALARAAGIEPAGQDDALEWNGHRRDWWIEQHRGAGKSLRLACIAGLDAGIDRPAEQQRIGIAIGRGRPLIEIARADPRTAGGAFLGLGIQSVGGRRPFAIPSVAVAFGDARRRGLDLADLGAPLGDSENWPLRPCLEQRIVELDL